MSFSSEQIASMLEQYEQDHQTGMEVLKVAEEIYQYTSGYPYLVSVICKYLDEEVLDKKGFEGVGTAWTKREIEDVVKILLKENTPLFGSMIKQLDQYKNLSKMIEEIIYQGSRFPFSV